jgi:formate dehydrogenase major subunit
VADIMSTVNITINGQETAAKAGQTVLEAAEGAAIDIPTLCHHPALAPYGACRMCLVEITGQRSLQPACTFKIAEGMEIQTESPGVVEARKSILQLLFSERNHFCMFCEMSGSCELQDLAYRYGLDHWIYRRAFPRLEVDASHPHFIQEPNRCILCERCVRVCAELVGNHTLGVRERGARSMIHADLEVSLGESSCISCGTCVQVCPTGALVDRQSAYLGVPDEVHRVNSTCTFCSVGCGVELMTSYNHLIRIDGDWDRAPNNGLLCAEGRFQPLDEGRLRLHVPMVRREGELQEAEWKETLEFVADRIRRLKGRLTGLSSPRLTNEALRLFAQLFRHGLGADVGSLVTVPGILSHPEDGLDVLDGADAIVVVGTDLTLDHRVVGYIVKRAITQRGARLILVDGDANGLAPHAYAVLRPGESARAIALCTSASKPAVVYGAGAGSDLDQLRKALSGKAYFVGLVPGANSRGAIAAGVNGSTGRETDRAYYVLAGDVGIGEDVMQRLEAADFVVVHSSYPTPLTDRADVVLPTTIWSEKAGHITNTEGRVLEVNGALEPPPGVRSDDSILRALAARLGVAL